MTTLNNHLLSPLSFYEGWPPPAIQMTPDWQSYSDQKLLSLYQTGHAQESDHAFCAIYNRYRLDVARYAGRCMDTEEETKDIFGDVWLKAYEKLKSFEWRGIPIRNWLLRTSHNMVLTRNRRNQREASEEDVKDYINSALHLDSPSQPVKPIDKVLRDEADQRVLQAVSTLKNPLQKKIIIAIYINGITDSQELAKLLKVNSASTIRVYHKRALKELKKSFTEAI